MGLKIMQEDPALSERLLIRPGYRSAQADLTLSSTIALFPGWRSRCDTGLHKLREFLKREPKYWALSRKLQRCQSSERVHSARPALTSEILPLTFGCHA